MISAVRGAMLNPKRDGSVEFFRDGVLRSNTDGIIEFFGPADHPAALPAGTLVGSFEGVILPPFLDAHIHIPQHPIRGHFMDGVDLGPPEGRLLAGLKRNVFPAEARCADGDVTREIARHFLDDTLAQGVIGGSAFMTVHADATAVALEMLPPTWSVGVALMNQNCPEYLRSDERTVESDLTQLAGRFGQRAVVTDRFAVSVSSELRRLASGIARRFELPTQTHLNEQIREKRFVEEKLYPAAKSYTHVYADDGLLDSPAILAHCIHMRPEELELLRDKNAFVAHCPTSNTLLCSGIMPLDTVQSAGIDYAICTDVGASPTTSMLCEMLQFLIVHRRLSSRATPREALYRSTLAPAKRLGLDRQLGTFEPGMPMTFIRVPCERNDLESTDIDEIILSALLDTSWQEIDAFVGVPLTVMAMNHLHAGKLDAGIGLNHLVAQIERQRWRLEGKVAAVVQAGREIWRRN